MAVAQATHAKGVRWQMVADTITNRRSNMNVDLERPVPTELIDDLIKLAVAAPNHYRTFPWRFVVLTGAARARLGELAAQAVARRENVNPNFVERQRVQFWRTPAVVVVASARDTDPVRDFENKHAVSAGVQNILLGASAAGLASAWRSGPPMVDADVSGPFKEAIGLEPDVEIVAVIYLGFPIGPPGSREGPEPNVRYLDQ